MDNETTISKIVELEINQKHIKAALKDIKNELIIIKNQNANHDEKIKNEIANHNENIKSINYKLENQVLTGKKIGKWLITITGILTACQFLLKWILK